MPQDRALSRNVGRAGLRRVALVAAVLALSVCSYASLARAGDSDDGDQSFTDKFLTTLGLKNPFASEYGINYSARSPLVVPPTRNLPPPEASGPPPAPNWPKDPDAVKRKAAKEESTGPFPNAVMESDRALRPDELMRNGSTKSNPTTSDQSVPIPPPDGAKKSIFSWINPNKEEYATFTGERARASLTDPPAGYMTPSPDQPYGIGKSSAKYKIPSVADRMEPTR